MSKREGESFAARRARLRRRTSSCSDADLVPVKPAIATGAASEAAAIGAGAAGIGEFDARWGTDFFPLMKRFASSWMVKWPQQRQIEFVSLCIDSAADTSILKACTL